MKRLYNKMYYFISFRPKQTINERMKGNEHHFTNTELYHMRTKQALTMLTFRNVITYKLSKLVSKLQKRNKHDN